MPEKQTISGIDAVILALKASGGYKYRAMIALQDGKELDSFIATSEASVRWMAHAIQVAEAMLKEKPPSIHDRWEEYLQRLGNPSSLLTSGRR